MLKTIAINQLRVGSYVESTGINCFQTELPKRDFFIVDNRQVNSLKRSGVRQVVVDINKGLDVTRDGFNTTLKSKRFAGFSMEHLLINEKVPCDLLIKEGDSFIPYLSTGQVFNDSIFNFLKCHYGKDEVYIYESEKGNFLKYKDTIKKEKQLSNEGLVSGFESPEKVKQYNDYLNNYIPVDSKVFFSGIKVPFCLYTSENLITQVLVKADDVIPENDFFCSNSARRKNLLIKSCDKDAYKDYVRNAAKNFASGNAEKDKEVQVAIVRENSKLVTKDLMENPRSGRAMKEAEATVMDLIDNILENATSFYGLMKLESFDYYTYEHSVNVCTLAIGLGVALNLPKKDELKDLALGTLMHDLGKSLVSSQLINKPGKLTEKEFLRIKNHVNLGYEVMRTSHESINERAFIPLLQHHEKVNGTGYPNNLKGDQIDILGKISAIVDVYDALTTERSYKKAFTPFEAVTLLKKKPEHYDQEIFMAFVQMLGKQFNRMN